MRAIVFDHFGDPGQVLQLRDVPVPEPGPGEVRVRMTASPINPSDLLVVRGEYGRLPRLPATPGFEGVGVLDAAGPGLFHRLRRLSPGRRVAVLNAAGGNWQEYVVIPARQAVPVPPELPDEQAAAFFVNPASALVMVRHVLQVPSGAWLLQTAAGSALGRMVIRLGISGRFRTINVVRRREQAGELLDAGGDAVVCTADESVEERVRGLTGGAGVPFALDAVGGATGSAAVRALAPCGRLLVYGLLSGEPLTVDPRDLIAGHKRVEGFWLANWVRGQNVLTMLGLFRRIGKLMAQGVLTSEVAASFPLEDVRQAVEQATRPGRSGKILFKMNV
jgi:NADPH:quinone reductase-like Zn-dependent oxidoreductase